MKIRLALILATGIAASAQNADFAPVERLFQAKCSACHSETSKTSGYSVANLKSVLAGGNRYGRAVVPGHPKQSPLVKLLTNQMQPRMPLGAPLSPAEIELVESWVRALPPEAQPATAQEWRWPFEKPVKRTPPQVRNAAWVRNPIDAFVMANLEEHSLPPAPPASPRVLARRLYFDLIGIIPSTDEVEAFAKDPSPAAYEQLVDRLLADPRYGERWGRHWLDLARYGETSGLEGDGMIGNAWRYRDWVINAFNMNMPYDKFVIQQLAGGDEHSKTRNNYQPDAQGLIPTGFLRLAPWDRSNLVAAEVRQNYLSEVTSTTSSVFLGLTVGCARCHDHKYDPIPQRDFYRMQAFFQASQAGPAPEVPYRDPQVASVAEARIKELEDRLKNGPEKIKLQELEAELLKKLVAGRAARAEGKELKVADLRLELKLKKQRVFTEEEKRKHAGLLEDATRTGDSEEAAALETYEKQLLPRLKDAYANGGVDPAGRFDALIKTDVAAEAQARYSANSIFSLDEKNRYAETAGAVEVVRRRLERWKPKVLAVTNVPGPPSGPALAPTRILKRGDYLQPGEAVEAGFPVAIIGKEENAVIESDRYRQFPTRGWRLTLAKWIASPDNPLTARVMVNRIWQHHLGQGIIRTTSDFGKNGERPTHPELLDWLAVSFVESGWDIKAMHKLILLSNTYQQAADNPADPNAVKDPANRLLSRFERRRLEAEVIRDSILEASGRLSSERGGPSVFPPLPADLADFARYGRTGGLMWEPNEKEEDARRRSVYIFQRRSLPLPMMASFDAPAFSESCDRRSSTTTPLQALSMMNGDLVHEEAAYLAAKIESEAGADRGRQVTLAFRKILNRAPQPAEQSQFAAFSGDLSTICRVLFNSNEFLYTE